MKKHFVLPVLFTVLLTAVGALYFFVPDAEISEDENRTLAQMPRFTLSSFLNGSFSENVDEYMKDQFPFRKKMIEAGERIGSFLSLGGGEVEMVVGENMDMGEGETLLNVPEPREDEPPAPAKLELADEADYNSRGIIIVGSRAMELFGSDFSMLENYASKINAIRQALPGDVKLYSLLVPTAGEFYSPVQYHEGKRSQKKAISDIYSMLMEGVTPVDAYTYLAAAADRYIYFRSDHHWTARGAYQGYFAFCKAAGLEAVAEDSFDSYNVEGGFLGTLYRYTKKQVIADNPDTVEVLCVPAVESCEAYTSASMTNPYEAGVIVDPGKSSNKYLTFLGGDNPLMRIVTTEKNGKRALVIKDSFGNAFTPFLVSHYEEIYVLDPRAASVSISQFCSEHAINDVIVENYAFAISNREILGGLSSIAR